ncbi:DNA polymerase III subunit beta [Candidatus Kaiserbacteria bacterium CG10_big_fil_rev_8_21_14_0_10_59_10]|uniref:Beta sliding clamp n=1 Tax=Candidatus Kaiserbacteria bacterium CG10_big_fil_rev_8_21_14_0_10_59_10 TaxID=1974612 RepID=A0A2H0UA01_9BACT|nr:MAG: DNA polymerase III subunit beta [Candidatus Kaiserbacteria bacterium CG10_big_fil_rev_8_21_14_0_10_59_10]
MNFSTIKEKLLSAVMIAERLVGKKETLPVLSCVLLEAGDTLSVRATNLEAGVEAVVPGEAKEAGIVAVPATILSQTLRAIAGDKTSLRLEGDNLLVESKGTRTIIKAVPHEEFPVITAPSIKKGVDVARERLLAALQSTTYAASSSMIRPELGSIFLSVENGKVTCVATDSFRLAEKVVADASGGGESDVLIPLKHALELSHILERLPDERVTLFVEDSQVNMRAEGLSYVSRVIDGTFPNYKEIVPKNHTTEATLLKGDFAEVLRKARIFAGAEQRIGFHVYPKKKVFDITAQSPAVGEMSDSLEAALSGEDLDIYFHIGYVADCLPAIQSDSVTLSFSGPGKPLVVRGVSDTSFMYLAMPLNR